MAADGSRDGRHWQRLDLLRAPPQMQGSRSDDGISGHHGGVPIDYCGFIARG